MNLSSQAGRCYRGKGARGPWITSWAPCVWVAGMSSPSCAGCRLCAMGSSPLGGPAVYTRTFFHSLFPAPGCFKETKEKTYFSDEEGECCTRDPWWPSSLTLGLVPHSTVLLAPLSVKQRPRGRQSLSSEPRAGASTYTTAGCEHLLLV